MIKSYKIRLCLLTYNRPFLAKIALNSLIYQTYKCEILISDNSTNNEFEEVYKKEFLQIQNLSYVRRKPSLEGIEHFNSLIKDSVNFDFVMFFHDDDILETNYLREIINTNKLSDENIAAIGTNATILKGNKVTKRKIFLSNKNKLITTKKELVNQYFNYEYNGAVPFPSYLYRVTSINKHLLMKKQGGKYSDIVFLLKLLDDGFIYWLHQPLMKYRIHSSNDSKSASVEDRNSLRTYISSENLFDKNLLLDYDFIVNKDLYNCNKIDKLEHFKNVTKFIITNFKNLRIFKIQFQFFKKLFLNINF